MIDLLPLEMQATMVETGVWHDWCPVALEDLRLITATYIDFNGITHEDGQIVVHHTVAEGTDRLFARLYAEKFPIHSMRLMQEFYGDDEASMANNNTSAFNCRAIAGSSKISLHAYGLAIDINPVQNPCMTFDEEHHPTISPVAGWEYMNRRNQKPGMIEPVITYVQEAGFPIWGGVWTYPIDYQHFQVERAVAEALG